MDKKRMSSAEMKQLQETAERGNAEAQWKLGTEYSDDKSLAWDIEASKKYLSMAADQGHIEAIYGLARCKRNYPSKPAEFDFDVPSKNEREIEGLLLKAAGLGHTQAQFEIGHYYLYANSCCVGPDPVEWYRKTIERGYDAAEIEMGWLWMRRAAENGCALAQSELDERYKDGIHTQPELV